MPEFRFIGEQVLFAKAMGALTAATNQAANDLVRQSAAATPVDTGTLRASIHTDGARVGGFSVTAKVATGGEANEYAIFVHEGTGPHTITAIQAKALAFDGHFAKSVHHPGTPAFKYLERPLLASRGVYIKFLRAASAAAF